VLLLAAIPVAALLILLLIGLFLPARHELARAVTLRAKPEAVFRTVGDVQNLPAWSSGVVKVEKLPDRDGKEVTSQTLKGGRKVVVITSGISATAERLRDTKTFATGTILECLKGLSREDGF